MYYCRAKFYNVILKNIGTCFENLQDYTYNTKIINLKECKVEVKSNNEQHSFDTSNKYVCKCISL
jgi:hypothetical protein